MKGLKNEPSGPSLHILFVLENYWPNIGGVENLFKKLAENLSGQGHRITVITTRLSPEDPAVQKEGNIQILRYRFLNRYFFTVLAIFPVFRWAKECDLVHTTSYNAALPAWLGSRLRRKKVIVTFHEVWGPLWFSLPFMSRMAKWAHYLFEQLLLRLDFSCFIGVSNATAENLKASGVPSRKVRMIYNGLDYTDFSEKWVPGHQAAAGTFVYTYFGRLGISKGLDILLEAAGKFNRIHPDSRFKLIIPKVPSAFLEWVRSEITRYNMEDHVDIHHHLSFEKLKSELLSSDCVVIPSYSEGFCFSAAESVALGIPVVSSGRTALKEVVSGRSITLSALTAESLVEALIKAKGGDWELSEPKKFRIEETVEAYQKLYLSCLEKEIPD